VSAFASFTSYNLLMRYAVRHGLPGEAAAPPAPPAPLSGWTAPDSVVWGVIASGFMLIPGVPALRQAGGNLLAVFGLVYAFQGMAIVASWFGRMKLSTLLRTLGWLLIALQPVIALAVCCVGLADTWADFRKVRAKTEAQ